MPREMQPAGGASRDARAGWPVYTMAEVREHATREDCWLVVHDKVYDMTPHVRNHEGWENSGKVSTLLAVLSAMGQDATEDFVEVRRGCARSAYAPASTPAVGSSPALVPRASPALGAHSPHRVPGPHPASPMTVQVHSDAAWRMLTPLQIGVLDRPNTPPRRVRFRSWEELQRAGVVD